MARIQATDLEDIFDTDLTAIQLNAFIAGAHVIVNENLVGKGLSEALLTEIEKWLAAHLASIRDQRVQSENIAGEYSVTYQGKTGLGLDATLYGQMVKQFDHTGTLATLGQKRASITVLRTPPHNTDVNRIFD